MDISGRAYSLLEVKSIDDEKRVLTGIATTPTVDRMGDIVEPKGAEFKLPIPFLWQHDAKQPVGQVTRAKVTKDGIEVQVELKKTDVPGLVKDRLDAAWEDLRLGLVRGLSIGFAPLESAQIDGTWGMRFIKWLWLELSAVTVAANGDCSIQTIKSIDSEIIAKQISAAAAKAQQTQIPAEDKIAATGMKSRVVSLNAPARDGAKPFVIRSIVRNRKHEHLPGTD